MTDIEFGEGQTTEGTFENKYLARALAAKQKLLELNEFIHKPNSSVDRKCLYEDLPHITNFLEENPYHVSLDVDRKICNIESELARIESNERFGKMLGHIIPWEELSEEEKKRLCNYVFKQTAHSAGVWIAAIIANVIICIISINRINNKPDYQKDCENEYQEIKNIFLVFSWIFIALSIYGAIICICLLSTKIIQDLKKRTKYAQIIQILITIPSILAIIALYSFIFGRLVITDSCMRDMHEGTYEAQMNIFIFGMFLGGGFAIFIIPIVIVALFIRYLTNLYKKSQ